jgi:hypothetical protein
MFFGVDIPRSSEITVKIRFVTGRGSADANEAEALETICQSQMVSAYIKKSVQSKRIKSDEDGAFRIPVKISWFALSQKLDEKDSEITVYPLWNGNADDGKNGQGAALDVIRTLVESMQDKHEHVNSLLETAHRFQDSYEKAVAAISQHSLQAMDKVSGHAATAFSTAAAPFADMGKSLVKALDDSRSHSATTAKESHDLLIEALKNRIVESNQVSKSSITQDIKEVMQLWPMLKGFLGEVESKPQT